MYSALVTTYECNGNGVEFTRQCIDSITSQTYRPIQCIVSDHSKNDEIENLIQSFDTRGVELIYLRYRENYGNPCHNWNNALKHATGKYLHYVAMDDRLAHPNAVADVIKHMDDTGAQWTATACEYDPISRGHYIPRWTGNILNENTIGGPTAIVIRDTVKHIQLDPRFIWVLDMDWYYRISLAVGPPSFFTNTFTYINRIHSNQLTDQIPISHKTFENVDHLQKYQTLQ